MRYLFAILYLVLMNSCSNEDGESAQPAVLESSFPQEFVLTSQSISGVTGAPQSEPAEFEETLVLLEDNQFTKTRIIDAETIDSSGSFELSIRDNVQVLELNHSENSPIIENCNGGTVEIFQILTPTSIAGGSTPCDGPGLFYDKK